jgi:hypothetical protein
LTSKAVQSWDVQVVLRQEDEVEIHAVFAGEALTSGRRLTMDQAIRQLEHWFASTPDAEMHLSLRTPDGSWRQIATRRWRVAAYFLLTHYERVFVQAPEAAESESVQTRSGVVSKAPPQAGAPSRMKRSSE